jgi:hypothetical protein
MFKQNMTTNKMEPPDYTKKLSSLRNRVNNHAKLEYKSDIGTINTMASIIPKININSLIFYIIPPIILIMIFLIIKPDIVCTEYIDVDNNITNKIHYKKAIIAGLISGVFISIGLFAFFRKKN